MSLIIPEVVLDLCASGRCRLTSRSGELVWINQKELPETLRHEYRTYSYVGVEYGVGVYQEIK